jgi:hypothetical protein
MDEDNPDLSLIQLEEKFEAKKEIWAHFDDEYGWTFNDWVEMTQNWKNIPKATKDTFLLRHHSHYWERALNKHGFFSKPKTDVSVPYADGQPVSSTKPG